MECGDGVCEVTALAVVALKLPMLAADLAIVTALDQQIKRLEAELVRTAKVHDPQAFHRLRTVPGIGPAHMAQLRDLVAP